LFAYVTYNVNDYCTTELEKYIKIHKIYSLFLVSYIFWRYFLKIMESVSSISQTNLYHLKFPSLSRVTKLSNTIQTVKQTSYGQKYSTTALLRSSI